MISIINCLRWNRVWTPAYKYTASDIESTYVIVVNGVVQAVWHDWISHRLGSRKPKLVEVMINVQAQTTSCTSIVLQSAAEGALTGMQSVVEGLRLTIQNKRNVIMQELKSFSGVRMNRPEGTFYACLISAPIATIRSTWRNSCSKKPWW